MWESLGTITQEIGKGISTLWNQAVLLLVHLYGILVRQSYVVGAQILFVALMWLLGGIVLWKLMKYINKKIKATVDKVVVIGAMSIILILAIVRFTEGVVRAIPYIANPEYYAIQSSVTILKGLQTKP
jgi:hypothetical protein